MEGTESLGNVRWYSSSGCGVRGGTWWLAFRVPRGRRVGPRRGGAGPGWRLPRVRGEWAGCITCLAESRHLPARDIRHVNVLPEAVHKQNTQHK